MKPRAEECALPGEPYQPQFALDQIGHDDQVPLGLGNDAEIGRPFEPLRQSLHARLLAPAEKRSRVPVRGEYRPVFHLIKAVQPADVF